MEIADGNCIYNFSVKSHYVLFTFSHLTNFLQILFFYSKQGEEDFDENGDGDGNGIFDDADEMGNNGDNNGEPMEES